LLLREQRGADGEDEEKSAKHGGQDKPGFGRLQFCRVSRFV